MSRTKGFRDLASYPLQTSYDTSIINFGRETSIIWRIAALRYSRIPMSCPIYQNYFLFHLFGQGLHHWGRELFNFVSYDPTVTTRILPGKEVYVKISVLPLIEWARRHAKGWCEPAIYPGLVGEKHELCFLRHADVASKSRKCLFKNEMLDT